jgi:nucleotide-binding universal stress UspA family protein
MRRVLVPVDGSPCSLRALRHMLDRQTGRGGSDEIEIHAVYVHGALPQEVSRLVSHDEIAEYRHAESERALKDVKTMLDRSSAPHALHEGVGSVAEVVTQLADSLHCEQITMGMHGRSALAELLLGSTTQKVIHLSRVPVLLVK